jgi:hypothetical protein
VHHYSKATILSHIAYDCKIAFSKMRFPRQSQLKSVCYNLLSGKANKKAQVKLGLFAL